MQTNFSSFGTTLRCFSLIDHILFNIRSMDYSGETIICSAQDAAECDASPSEIPDIVVAEMAVEAQNECEASTSAAAK